MSTYYVSEVPLGVRHTAANTAQLLVRGDKQKRNAGQAEAGQGRKEPRRSGKLLEGRGCGEGLC